MENKTKGQLERMQWYNNLCKETGYEPLRGILMQKIVQ